MFLADASFIVSPFAKTPKRRAWAQNFFRQHHGRLWTTAAAFTEASHLIGDCKIAAKIIGDYHGLVVRSQTKVTPEVFAAAKNLKVIGRAGVGVDNIDRAAATDHGVVVEAGGIAERLPEIAKVLVKNGETVVEMSVSQPSLEDVFLKMTGLKLREVAKTEAVKRNWRGEQS